MAFMVWTMLVRGGENARAAPAGAARTTSSRVSPRFRVILPLFRRRRRGRLLLSRLGRRLVRLLLQLLDHLLEDLDETVALGARAGAPLRLIGAFMGQLELEAR